MDEIEASFNEEETPLSYCAAFLSEERRRKREGEDVGGYPVSQFLSIYYTITGSFTRMQLVAAANDLWGAGFETTVNTLKYAVHYLVNRPDIQDRLHQELTRIVGDRVERSTFSSHESFCFRIPALKISLKCRTCLHSSRNS